MRNDPEKTLQSLYLLEDTNQYVIVSAVDVVKQFRLDEILKDPPLDILPETYIFASDEKGKWCSGEALPGSFRGSMDHAKALENMGYRIVYEGERIYKTRLELIDE